MPNPRIAYFARNRTPFLSEIQNIVALNAQVYNCAARKTHTRSAGYEKI